jgi:hypothetical protein
MLVEETSSQAETWRGAVVAVSLALLALSVFLLIAYGRQWKMPAPPRPIVRSTPMQKPEDSSPKPGKRDRDDGTAPPGVPLQSDAAEDGGGAGGLGGGSGAAQTADNAPDALRLALQGYKANPNRTATISISTSGRIGASRGGELTTLDGLPASQMRKGLMLSGTGASRVSGP